ncbi:LppU/SCO3897 family protein [Streptomyces sp. NPDC002550]
MSTPPSPYPGYQQAPGPYPQQPAPYQQAPGPYAQVPGAYQQPAPGAYQQPSPGAYQQAPGPYAPQQAPGAYGQPQAPYQQAPGAYPSAAAPASGGPGCEVCGAAPAARMTIRGHQGMLIIMRNLWRKGTFCHTCGLAVFRKMQSDTLAQGWWGPMSMLITPITLLINLFTLSKIRKLPAPVAPQGPGLDPGRPVFSRPTGIVGLFPLTAFAVLVLLVLVGLAAG